MSRTIKISKFIKELQKIQDIFGDVSVVMSRDPEGNGYNTLDPSSNFPVTCTEVYDSRKILILYPFAELEDLGDVVNEN